MKRLLLFTATLLFFKLGFCQTYLNGGNLTESLTKSKSPYIVTATINVPKSATLTIEPGVQILFNDGCHFEVYGVLQAKGTTTDPITFTASDTTLGWEGVRIYKNTSLTTTNLFEHCEFSYAYKLERNFNHNNGAILLDTVNTVEFNHCTFSRNISLIGGAIRANFSENITINDCNFIANQATDTSKSNPILVLGPIGSCIYSNFSSFDIKGSSFKHNSSTAPRYPKSSIPGEEIATSMIYLFGNKCTISDCSFEKNHSDANGLVEYSGAWYPELNKDSFLISNCVFNNNSTASGSIIRLDGSDYEQVTCRVYKCSFKENYSYYNGTRGDVIYCYNNFGQLNRFSIDKCTLVNNKTQTGIMLFADANVSLTNTTITGQKGFGLTVRSTTQVTVANCILNNNWVGIESAFNAEFGLLNSIVAYNGRIDTAKPYPIYFPNGRAYAVSGGVVISNRGKINIGNSIITGNKNHLGNTANIVGNTDRTIFPGLITNTVLEGGIDSTHRRMESNGKYTQWDTIPFSSINNVLTDPVSFVNPPQGVGVDFVSDDIDLHIKQTCDSSKYFNAGLNYVPGYSLSSWPEGKDLDGNPRISCSTMDIGPYEFKGPKGYTYLESSWDDTSLCANTLEGFNPQVCGENVQYHWQKSSDNSSWKTMEPSTYNQNKLINPADGYYRVITSQQECNVIDTFGPSKLTILPIPKPDLGDDKILYKGDTLYLSPGKGFTRYVWSIPGGDTSQVRMIASRYPSFGSRDVWCMVFAENGCSARDSVIVYFRDPNNSVSALHSFDINFYPNPNSGTINIDLPSDFDLNQYRITNANGMVVHKESIYLNPKHLQINLNDLSPGTYVLTLESKTNIVHKTMIIQ